MQGSTVRRGWDQRKQKKKETRRKMRTGGDVPVQAPHVRHDVIPDAAPLSRTRSAAWSTVKSTAGSTPWRPRPGSRSHAGTRGARRPRQGVTRRGRAFRAARCRLWERSLFWRESRARRPGSARGCTRGSAREAASRSGRRRCFDFPPGIDLSRQCPSRARHWPKGREGNAGSTGPSGTTTTARGLQRPACAPSFDLQVL